MSTDILGNSEGINDMADKEIAPCEGLSEYVTRIMYERRLTVREVERQSGGRIDQSYVSRIAQGIYTNLTVEKAQALAAGLDVDEDELFKIARGVKSGKSPDQESGTSAT